MATGSLGKGLQNGSTEEMFRKTVDGYVSVLRKRTEASRCKQSSLMSELAFNDLCSSDQHSVIINTCGDYNVAASHYTY